MAWKVPHPHTARLFLEERGHPLPHLARGFVREGDRENAIRWGTVLTDQVGDPAREDAGLSRSSPSEDQEWPFEVANGLELFRVQPGQVVERRRRLHLSRRILGVSAHRPRECRCAKGKTTQREKDRRKSEKVVGPWR